MPNYTYRCDNCSYELNIFHSINDILVRCGECYKEALVRVPQSIIDGAVVKQQKTGTIVKDYIKDAKIELEHQKSELKNEIYNDE
jgi:putative FmdB family regulatory protein|tara:strand:+ start:44139 stop:44393 length:255 start_codon:yes stop_codon:yes gene_type:complete